MGESGAGRGMQGRSGEGYARKEGKTGDTETRMERYREGQEENENRMV